SHTVRDTLLSLDAELCDFRLFPDHHPYSRSDIEDLRNWANKQARDCLIVTTQKDMVKLRLSLLGGRPLWALRISMELGAGRDMLDGKLNAALNSGSRGKITSAWYRSQNQTEGRLG